MIGGPPRSDMTPPIQMTAGPPLLVQAAGAPHYAYVPQPNFPQVLIPFIARDCYVILCYEVSSSMKTTEIYLAGHEASS